MADRYTAEHADALAALAELVAEWDQRNAWLAEDNPGTIGYRDTGGIEYARAILLQARGVPYGWRELPD